MVEPHPLLLFATVDKPYKNTGKPPERTFFRQALDLYTFFSKFHISPPEIRTF